MIKLTLYQGVQFACCVLIFALGQTPCFARRTEQHVVPRLAEG
jgi:hypothetical protein